MSKNQRKAVEKLSKILKVEEQLRKSCKNFEEKLKKVKENLRKSRGKAEEKLKKS